MLPAQRDNLPRTQATQSADSVGDVQRLWQVQVDAAHVFEFFYERHRSRIVGRLNQSPSLSSQNAHWIRGDHVALHEVSKKSGQERDQNSDGPLRKPLFLLQHDEIVNRRRGDLVRLQMREVRCKVLLPPIAVTCCRSVGRLASLHEGLRILRQRFHLTGFQPCARSSRDSRWWPARR